MSPALLEKETSVSNARVSDDRPVRAAIYARISLDSAGRSEGVERQETACRLIAEREGWEVVEVFTDNDISAYSGVARPAYEKLLAVVERREVDAVIAYHADRLYRRTRDLDRLVDVIERGKIQVLTATSGEVDLSTATGRMVAKVLAAVSEHESARIGERVSAKHRANAEKGRAHGGGRPFGYDRVEDRPGVLVVNEEEAELVREAAQRILRGASLNSIVIDWNERGIPTVNGKNWRPNSLSKMLRAGRIAGLREVDGEVLGPGSWEPIIDREQWERVRSRITHAPKGRRPMRALLAGMVVCGRCGARMRSVSGGNDKYRQPGYQCDKAIAHGCGSNAVKGEAVEQIVVAHVLAALEGVNLAAERARRTVRSSASLVGSIGADEQMLTDLAADLGARRITRAEWLAAREPIEERLAAARRELEQVAADSDLDDAAFEGVSADRWDELSLEQKRAVIRLFVARVEVAKGTPGRTFDRTRVKIVPT